MDREDRSVWLAHRRQEKLIDKINQITELIGILMEDEGYSNSGEIIDRLQEKRWQLYMQLDIALFILNYCTVDDFFMDHPEWIYFN